MIKSISEAIKVVNGIIDTHIGDVKFSRELAKEAKVKYNCPIELISDITSKRKEIDENPFLVYILFDLLCNSLLPYYFSEAEIKTWKDEKYYKEEKIEFPISFNMIQVAPNQWIGKITVRELMKLRDNKMIRYNENTQRTLRKITRGGEEYYRIYLNRNAVEGIKESYVSNSYIPNIITLNLPEEAEFSYSAKLMQLTIFNAEYFDILDGYHRYIAMSDLYNTDKSFDYDMELRIVCFPEEKSRQFIWQEDQKTKMRKVDSDYLNQINSGNQIVNMLAETEPFVGKISRNQGMIDAAIMAKTINQVFFDGAKNKISRSELIAVRKTIVEKAKQLEYEKPDVFERRWNNQEIIAFIVACSKEEDFVETYERMLIYANALNIKPRSKNINRAAVSTLKNS